ncbi:MAG: hypothetical protein H0W83_17745 [Planctomycetes bacterium]|nr:hypothetical protein [Planctomycetota bacterium]
MTSLNPLVLAAVLLTPIMPAIAEELDVLTLRNGRHLEGHYDDRSHILTFGGSVSGSVQVQPGDILKREKLILADAAEAKVAVAPVPAPADGKGAAPTAAKDSSKDVLQAKRVAGVRSMKKSQLKKDLQSSIDYQKTYELNIAKMEAERADLPARIQSMDGSVSAARQDLNTAQSRYTYVQQDYDAWYAYRRHNSAWGGASVSDARDQRDKADRKLKKLESELDAMRKRQSRITTELPSDQAKLKGSIERQAMLAADIKALELEEANAAAP